ncbi:hypothetical protein OBBRIDRAFT_731106 [Obba rivulosa]|uniref:DNA repair and recombination protein RAD54B n=1 Tax=Obba rivulosa TaxID=1052685 RepID=A0A8E2AXV0_9APHY|nr:hypothetical protein OBBRIDRAFT_731106 [Obba rivulosa]
MPAFLNPQTGALKRKSDANEVDGISYKRQAVDGVAQTSESAKAAYQRGHEQYWMVQWRNPQYKKNKHWEGDAVLVVCGNICKLHDMDGKEFTSGKAHGIDGVHRIDEGVNFSVGSKELEVEYAVKREDFLSGKCFGLGKSTNASANLGNTNAVAKQFKPLRPKVMNNSVHSSLASAPDSKGKGIQLEAVDLVSAGKSRVVENKDSNSFWTVNWRKPQHKKHKTWEGDGYLMLRDGMLSFVSDRGVILGRKKWDRIPLHAGYRGFISGKDIELNCEISEAEMPVIMGTSIEPDLDIDIEPQPSLQTPSSVLLQARRDNNSPISVNSPAIVKNFVAPSSFYGKPPPKPKPKGPLHDPSAEGAIVMKAPTEKQMAKISRKGGHPVPVVIDPVLGRRLRPHQIEGVKFMYECVMGMGEHDGRGCILADEMGMGKTLQTITLIWTLLKQNPCSGVGPAISKALIVCPVTLINNWKNEFHKWLGKDRIGVFVGDKDKKAIKQFNNSRIHQVLVIGYERLRTVIDDLAYCQPPIDLIICDEGHRLKSANNKTSAMFQALSTKRRVILSGTPIQNDLSEFHAMADFCNPGLLDTYPNFRRLYETPILKSRAPGCTTEEKEIGEGRSAQLMTVARSFVLRRDASTLKKYLPPKYEYVVFVTPTKLQLSIFQKLLTADRLDSLVRNSTAESLALINMLTKISNSPILLKATVDHAKSKANAGGDVIKQHAIQEALTLLPGDARVEDVGLSGKLSALARLLKAIRKTTEEKCIIVSHYTSTLNIIEAFCKRAGYTYHRLDGQTPAQKRQEYVNEFNKASQTQRFLFLLSSKAGGVGLNLVGASRLCLVDSDWNPSHDLQSMARIHRDGQKRPVFIYRLLTAGAIDEKIYQRQVTKIGLSDSSESKSDSFTHKDLRDIFTVYADTPCHTHDLLECPCEASDQSGTAGMGDMQDQLTDGDEYGSDDDGPKNFVVASHLKADHTQKLDRAYRKQKKAQLAALGQWTHINCLKPGARSKIQDELLSDLLFDTGKEKPGSVVGRSRLATLFGAVDLENVLAESAANTLTVDQVPGGTISFLFERSSIPKILSDDRELDD